MQQRALELRRSRSRIALVPTMGYLHEAHLTLVRRANSNADTTVVSIFVNPTQFGPKEDYRAYPRDVERDYKLCEREGVDIVFAPNADQMYEADHDVYVDGERLTLRLEGTCRPGHFRGVATVVAKLFNVVLPDTAIFGEKDYQQLRVIQQMVADLNFPIEIMASPLIREPDGLAMSSRNSCLSKQERKDALCLNRGLQKARVLFQNGERNPLELKNAIVSEIGSTPSAHIDYVEIVDRTSLEPMRKIDCPSIILIAVYIGTIRLLDNLSLD